MPLLNEELIKQYVIDQLAWDDSIDVNKIRIDVNGSTVRLQGKVPNLTTRLAAERDALLIAGVTQVENLLDIEFPPRLPIPTDGEITKDVEAMFRLDSRIQSQDIIVKTDKGIVTLSGKVSSYWKKNAVGTIAGNVKSVVEVVNKLSVNLGQVAKDADIKKDIENAYRRNMLIDEVKIAVSVVNGIARLSGTVSNYLIKNEVFNIAIYTRGVLNVVDEVTIG